jgi:hypothetical protein
MGRSIGGACAFAKTIFIYFVDFVSICVRLPQKPATRSKMDKKAAERGVGRPVYCAHSKTG